jgi:hypothetical protein
MNRQFMTCKIAVYAALLSSLANAADAQNAESLSGTSGRYAAVMEMDSDAGRSHSLSSGRPQQGAG